MKANFIPLNDNLDKLIAFTPSLDKGYREGQKISSKEYQIETLDVIDNLRDKGWKIKGSYQELNKRTRQISNHTIKMEHPDFNLSDNKGNIEGLANLTISNSCSGTSPLSLNLGMFREICTNGMVARDVIQAKNLKHNSKNYYQLGKILEDLNVKTQIVMKEFQHYQNIDLTHKQMVNLAIDASKKRFGTKNIINPNHLLNTVRDEDEGNSLWVVFNRIQENLTQPNRLIDLKGNTLPGINSIKEDIKINKQLSDLVYAYA